MAFVPNYEHDIFLSYAHDDNQQSPGVTRGWVSTFYDCLKTKLDENLGRDKYSFWMDHDLQSHQPLTEQIMNAARKSATIIVVLSPGYLRSEWCKRERNAFLEFIKGPTTRVFVIERDKIDSRPPEFNDLKGFQFWIIDREGKPPHILGTPEIERERSDNFIKYYDIINDLSWELKNELGAMQASSGSVEMRGSRYTSTSIIDSVNALDSTVYLAQVTDDLEYQRNDVMRNLKQAGIYVLPETIYSLEPAEFRQYAERDLAKSSLFVQLLSGIPGKKPQDLPQGYIHLQLDLAKEHHKPILQWRSPTLDVSLIGDKDHRLLVEGDVVRAEGIEDFKREIRKRIFDKPKPVKSINPVNTFVFVDMETSDRPLAEQICNVLERYGIDYSLPTQGKNPAKNRKDLEQNLQECTHIIIIYGISTVDWVRQTLRESRKILAVREEPLQALAVFEGPPEKKCPLDMKIAGMKILNSRREFDETELVNFLELLKEGEK